jgi:hypothetical protein
MKRVKFPGSTMLAFSAAAVHRTFAGIVYREIGQEQILWEQNAL